MREIEDVGNAFEELEEVKSKLAGLLKSKGYEQLVQWESPSDPNNVISAGINEKLTNNLVQTLSVNLFYSIR